LTESVATPMGMHATKDRVESDTSTVYSISLYESTITTRDEPWFGELKLALGVKGLPVTARDRILRCSPPVVGTTRAGPPFRKMKGPNKERDGESGQNGVAFPSRKEMGSRLAFLIEQIRKKNHIEK
ncbi:hypothetical protein S245_062480, partial [Arachis hypogaea]